MTSQAVLKDLILELIYPAVLGGVLYFALDFVSLVANTVTRPAFCHGDWDYNLVLKCTLLVSTLVFYGCDYTYTMLTPDFEVLFFVFDCIFLAGLYATIVRMRVKECNLNLQPEVRSIAVLFATFMVSYYLWDLFEYRRKSGREKDFFHKMMWWEAQSLCGFASVVVALTLWPANSFVTVAFAFILAASTIRFFFLVRKKRVFSREFTFSRRIRRSSFHRVT